MELALAMHSRLRHNTGFIIIHAGPLLPGYPPRARDIINELLRTRAVFVVTGRRVAEIEARIKQHLPEVDIEGTEPIIPAFP